MTFSLAVALLVNRAAVAADAQQHAPRMLVGTLSLPDERFLEFVERVRPDFVVMGAFGAPQWAAQENPRQWLARWRAIIERLHRRDV